jgi:type II secretory pathway predicted ATPase ExeA
MYLEHFSLREHPFQLTPDSDFLYMSESHARAKAYMDYTIWNRDGFVVITGEIGAGKTTLIQKLLSEFDENALVAKIFQTQLDETEFLQAILVEFGLNPFNARKVELMDMLSSFLIEQFTKSKQLVLIVDEAQNLLPVFWRKFACCQDWKRRRKRFCMSFLSVNRSSIRFWIHRKWSSCCSVSD